MRGVREESRLWTGRVTDHGANRVRIAIMKRERVTFRRQPRDTVLFRVGHSYSDVDIKIDGKICGVIYAESCNRKKWEVWFMVIKKDILEDKNPNCPWMNKPMAAFQTEEQARQAVPKLIARVRKEGYDFHFFEKED